jgi:hypothetical protein
MSTRLHLLIKQIDNPEIRENFLRIKQYLENLDTEEEEEVEEPETPTVVIPTSTLIPYSGLHLPEGGYLWADGNSYNAEDYPDLAYQYWDSSTSRYVHGGTGTYPTGTFNVPDTRGTFIRGLMDITTVTGSGSAASNNATFTSHGLIRTGLRVRVTSGTLTGLATSTDYYVIVIDSNTLAFATTYANALAGTKIVISGVNSAVITQQEDPDTATRLQSAVGGNTSGLGSRQFSAVPNITGFMRWTSLTPGSGSNITYSGAVRDAGNASMSGYASAGSASRERGFDLNASFSSAVYQTTNEARSQNLYMRHIIKT